MTRRIRGGKEYFYARFPGEKEKYLGSDFETAVLEWHRHWQKAGAYTPNAFSAVADQFEKAYLPAKSPKTQKEYTLGLNRLKAVFENAHIESITRGDVAALRDELRDTPTQANRLLALLSVLWNWARERELTDAPNPCADITKYSLKRRTVRVTPEMFYAVLDEGDQVLKDWMRLDWMIADRVTDILRLRRDQIEEDRDGKWLRATAAKTDTEGRIKIEGDLEKLIAELKDRKRKATGPWLIQTDEGQRVTYAMLRKRFDAAREKAKEKAGEAWKDWQMRDLRKASLNSAATLEEARRRAKHRDPRTTARHYELTIDAVPAALPERDSTDNLGQIATNGAKS